MNDTIAIGRIISLTFQALIRDPYNIGRLSLIISFLPSLLTGYLAGSGPVGSVVGIILDILISSLLSAALMKPVMTALGASENLTDTLSGFTQYALPVCLFGIMSTIGIMVGVIALIIPGLYLMTIWCVGIPVITAENRTMTEAFRRSSDLTEGHRWHILAVLILLTVLSLLPAWPVYAFMPTDTELAFQFYIVAEAGFVTLANIIMSITVIVIYLELKWIKEGIGPETVGDVFD